MTLNERAWKIADILEADAARLRVAISHVGGVTRIHFDRERFPVTIVDEIEAPPALQAKVSR